MTQENKKVLEIKFHNRTDATVHTQLHTSVYLPCFVHIRCISNNAYSSRVANQAKHFSVGIYLAFSPHKLSHILSENKDNHQSRSHHLVNSDRGIFLNENAVAKAEKQAKKEEGVDIFSVLKLFDRSFMKMQKFEGRYFIKYFARA